jgi:hypothetical protein
MSNRITKLTLIITSALVLMLFALINQYPLLYSDTACYVSSGFNLKAPNDRPIIYGLLLRLFSLNGRSIWLALFIQTALLAWIVLEFLSTLFQHKIKPIHQIFIIVILCLTTGISWTSSMLIADVYTSIAILAFINFMLRDKIDFISLFSLCLFIIAAATHASHILLFNALFSILFLYSLFKNNFKLQSKMTSRLLMLFLGCNLTLLTSKNAMNKSGHVFFAGAMVENGMMKRILDDQCSTNTFKMCSYKDSLPNHGYLFLWEGNSPLYKIGGWEKSREEFNELARISFSTPEYLLLQCKASAKATLNQLLLFKIGDGNGQFLEGTGVYNEVTCWFKFNKGSYLSSLQNRNEFNFLEPLNKFFDISMLLFTITLLFAIFYFRKKTSKQVLLVISILLLSVLLNAFVSGTFANAIDRLGCKMMWFIPLSLLLILIDVRLQRPNIKES